MNNLKKAQIIFLVIALNVLFVFPSHADKKRGCLSAFYGVTALMYASQQGDVRTVVELINSGADVNAINKNRVTNTALMYAVHF